MADDRVPPGHEPHPEPGREHAPAADPDDPSIVAELLADPAAWIEPPAALEDGVVGAVAAHVEAEAHARRGPACRPRRFVLIASAAAAVIVLVVAAVALRDGSRPADFRARLEGTALAPAAHTPPRGSSRVGWFHRQAARARPHDTSTRRVLPSLAAERVRDARTDRHVQLERRGDHALVGGLPDRLPHDHRDDRAVGRRPVVLRAQGAGRYRPPSLSSPPVGVSDPRGALAARRTSTGTAASGLDISRGLRCAATNFVPARCAESHEIRSDSQNLCRPRHVLG